jgi:hypothetical protein
MASGSTGIRCPVRSVGEAGITRKFADPVSVTLSLQLWGRVMAKVVPSPTLLLTSILPAITSTIFPTM